MPISLRIAVFALAAGAAAPALPAQESAAPASADSVTAQAPAPGPAPRRARSTSTVLVAEDIRDAPFLNVYELIRARRPNWLRVRTGTDRAQTDKVMALVDHGAPVEVDELRNIGLEAVERLEFRSSFDVSQRGANSQGYAGTILVTIRR